MTDMEKRALEQVQAAGRKGLMVQNGWESMTQNTLVERDLIWQEHGIPGHWKFTITPSGKDALTG